MISPRSITSLEAISRACSVAARHVKALWRSGRATGRAAGPGDARYRSIKRVASAVGDGATVVRLAHEYLITQAAVPVSLSRVTGG